MRINRIILAIIFLITGNAFSTEKTGVSKGDFISSQLSDETQYSRDVAEYLVKNRANAVITPAERIRYSTAYAYYAWQNHLAENKDMANRSMATALNLAPSNPVALFVAGTISESRVEYLNAAGYYKQSANPRTNPFSEKSHERLSEIAKLIVNQASELADAGRFAEAQQGFAIAIPLLPEKEAAQVAELHKRCSEEIAADTMLSQAMELIRLRRDGDAQRILKELVSTYSWTRAADEGRKIMLKSDDLFVRAQKDSIFSELAAREKWKILETQNFIIYYQNNDFAREAARVIEDVFRKVMTELDLKNVNWKNSRCKVFLFDDNETWKSFVKDTGIKSEWAAAFASSTTREIFGNASEGKRLLESTLPHELTHVIHYEYLGGRTVSPVWLSEGLAVKHQFDDKRRYYQRVKTAVEEGSHFTLDELTEMKTYPESERVSLFYATSLSFVEFIIEGYGTDTFARLNRYVRSNRGRDLDLRRICRTILREDPDTVEKKWRNFIIYKTDGNSERMTR